MWLLVGLGNPGKPYAATRHNAGFWWLESIARQLGAGPFKLESKFQGLVSKGQCAGEDVLLVMPQNFMNRSGLSVGSVAKFYKIPVERILVAHDELDMVPGIARLKTGGGHGGHNGLRDLIAHLGSADFHRLRIGIGHPGDRAQVSDYVLSAPSKIDLDKIERAIDVSLPYGAQVIAGAMQTAMNGLHTELKG
jgi:PTH1 family peptidyl-tRNA hydrolase